MRARTGSASVCRGIRKRGRSWRCRLQVAVDGERGELAVLHGRDREVLAARDTVAARPDVVDRGLALCVHLNAAAGDAQHLVRGAELAPGDLLPDRLEHDVRVERECLAGALELPVRGRARALEFDPRDVFPADQSHRTRPVADAHAARLREFLLESARAHLFGPATINDRNVLRAEPPALYRRIDR